jgi:hypothetical protein
MSGFEFRLRFNLLEGDRIEDPAEEKVLLEDSDGRRLRLKSGEAGVPIKERSRAALLGGPYATEQEARAAATQAKRAILIWAVSQRAGIDLGDGKLRGGLTAHGREWLSSQVGGRIRNDVHGIDVYTRENSLKFVSLNVKASVGRSSKTFAEIVATEFVRRPAKRPLRRCDCLEVDQQRSNLHR